MTTMSKLKRVDWRWLPFGVLLVLLGPLVMVTSLVSTLCAWATEFFDELGNVLGSPTRALNPRNQDSWRELNEKYKIYKWDAEKWKQMYDNLKAKHEYDGKL